MIDFDINASVRSEKHSSVKRRSITSKLVADDPYGEGGATHHDEIQIEGLDSNDTSREEERETLLASKKKMEPRMPACYGFRRCMGWIPGQEKRSINLNGTRRPKFFGGFPTNRQNN